jgi:hypothetical protein
MIRMTPEDATHGLGARSRLTSGSCHQRRPGASAARMQQGLDTDPLLRALLAQRDEFGWINHTYEHRDLDAASRGTIEADIAGNRRWADQVGERLRRGRWTTLATWASPTRCPGPGCWSSRPSGSSPRRVVGYVQGPQVTIVTCGADPVDVP